MTRVDISIYSYKAHVKRKSAKHTNWKC